MDKAIQPLFFSLLRYALFHRKEQIEMNLSGDEYSRLYALACQQGVPALVLSGLTDYNVNMSKDKVLETIALIQRIKQENRHLNSGVIGIHKLLEDSNVNYAIVKGQAVASYYPVPSLRSPGDVDYYCNNENFQNSLDVLKNKWGIKVDSQDSDIHVHYVYNRVTFEGHFSLFNFYNAKKNNRWNEILMESGIITVNIEDCPIKTLSPTIHVLYIFLHLYSHLIKLGIGIRQFCDLAVMLHYNHHIIDYKFLSENIEYFGMKRAYKACGSILVDYLGISTDELGFKLAPRDRKYGKRILNVVFYRGNMGHYEGNRVRVEKNIKRTAKAIFIKATHFFKFFLLAPAYNSRWMLRQIKRMIVKFSKR
mgnify:CR=1 FL=1